MSGIKNFSHNEAQYQDKKNIVSSKYGLKKEILWKLKIQRSMCLYISICIFYLCFHYYLRDANGNKNCLDLFRLSLSSFFWWHISFHFQIFPFKVFLPEKNRSWHNLTWFLEIRGHASLPLSKFQFQYNFWSWNLDHRHIMIKGDKLTIWWKNVNALVLRYVCLQCSSV